jgi:O-antigen ligase
MEEETSVRSERHEASLRGSRQVAAAATAFLLPISTTGTAVSMAALVALILSLTRAKDWLATLQSPAAVAPLALFALIAVSATWSPEPLGPGGISHYAKLLLIPLIMGGGFTREQAVGIAQGFLAGCFVLLMLSFASFFGRRDLGIGLRRPTCQ